MSDHPMRIWYADSKKFAFFDVEDLFGRTVPDMEEGDVLQRGIGMDDINGKGIFEGDYVEHIVEDPPRASIVKHFVIYYDKYQAAFRSRYTDWFRRDSGAHDGKPVEGLLSSYDSKRVYRVIGNICENPNLVK